MKYFFAVILICLLLSSSKAQPSFSLLKEYSIETWTTEKGLPSNNLRQVYQDKRGYIWMSSYNGLIRFDGHSFDIYTSDELPNLKSNAFKVISEDDSGKMYFGTQTSGLFNFDGVSFEQSSIANSFSKSITSIFSDSRGRVWVGAQDQGLYLLENDTSQYKRFSSDLLNENTINGITELKNGNIWFATNEKGVISYDNNGFNEVTTGLINAEQFNCISEFNNKQYVGTNNGVYYLEDNDWRILNGTSGFYINFMKFDGFGHLWIATETGLIRILPSGTIENLKEEDGLPSRQISSLAIDNEDNVWLATKRSGLVLMRKSNFKNISSESGLSSPFVNIVYQLNDGSMAFGNDNGTVDQLKLGKIIPMSLKTNLLNVSVKDIIQDRNNNIWLATYRGLIKIGGGREELFTKSEGMASINTRWLFEDRDGNIWVGSKDGGLVKIKPNGNKKIYNKESGLSDEYVLGINQLPNGTMIIGTYQGGINFINSEDEIVVKNISDDDSSPLIFNIEVVDNDEYWIATNVGLFKFQDDAFYKIDKDNGLQIRTIFDAHHDNRGYIWLTSNLGVVRLSTNSVTEYIAGERLMVSARLYDENDGMMSRECTGATKLFATEDGQLWIPTSKGVSIIDPADIHVNDKIPPVYIKDVKVDDVTLEGDISSISLGPETRKLVIDYTALSYYSPAKINFQYRLRGYEKDWNDVGNIYSATYMNLPDGRFTFEVKASNSDGVWNEEPASIRISLDPFFYKSRLFLLLSALFLAVIAFIIYWIRIKVVEDKNRELNKLNKELDSFVYSVSHDLRAPLASILGLLNISKLDKEAANIPVYMNKIETSVNKLDDFIKDIISYSRNVRLKVEIEEVDIKLLVEDILEGLEYMNPRKDIEVIIDASANTIIHSDRTRLYIVFNNIISNSLRYYKNYIKDPFINIKIRVSDTKAIIIVEDNGIGIKPDRIGKIFDMFYRATSTSNGSGLGLYIAKESVAKLDGTISVESEFERGTKFTLIIPNLL